MMYKFKFFTSGDSYLLLVFIMVIFNSCKNDKDGGRLVSIKSEVSKSETGGRTRDSAVVKFILPPKEWAPMINGHNYLPEERLRFKNQTDRVDTVALKISVGPYHHLRYNSGAVDENGNNIHYSNTMLIRPEMDEIILEMDQFYKLVDFYPPNLMSIDSIANDYHKLDFSGKQYTSDERFDLYKEVHKKHLSKVHDDSIATLYNDLRYYTIVSRKNPGKSDVWNFFVKYNNDLITGGLSRGLNFSIAKHYGSNIDSLLNLDSFDLDLQAKFAQGSIAMLSNPDFQNKPEYDDLKSWLKTTELYKKNKDVQKLIEPLSNDRFIEFLKHTITTDGEKLNQQLISEKPFYLIDFWATWCAPCIQGVQTMKEMDMLRYVQVVSISVDKDKDHEKWQKMTKKLGQEVSFRLSDSIKENREFLKFIELESIPRYILMDKDFNLIDQAFYHPQEPQFLSKLKDVKNHKRW